MMDTGYGATWNRQWGYSHLLPLQIEWYKWAVDGMAKHNADTPAKSFVFKHIPFYEYNYAHDLWVESGFCETIGFGHKMREVVCSPPKEFNNGFFNVIKEYKNTTHVFVGHEHINNFTILYEGIWLTYTLKTGDRSYFNADLNGGTVITINSLGDVDVRHHHILWE
jgi:hypothetical protein